MSCEKPLVAPITDECCFNCFTEGRLPYGTPIAIVLHEVDEHIEALNNRMENCCGQEPDCHSSFHYGVGHDGRIVNWVSPDNTAWSFDPVNTDADCGVCGWSIATQEGNGVDPNLYTINIAVSTGILAYNQSSPNRLAENNYTDDQYDALVRLVGWLAETYGVTINQNNIWRHCDELDDFPAGCCANDDCNLTYSDFLTAVQDCIDATGLVLPWLCDAMCDAPVMAGDPTYVFGADAECNECGRYQIGPTTQENFCTLMAGALTPQVPAAAPGVLLVTADCESAPMPTVCELIAGSSVQTGAVVTDQSVTFFGNDCMWHAINQTEVDLCAEITAHVTNDAGEAVPGQTNLIGLDCNYYQLPDVPDFCSLLFAATAAYDDTLNFAMLQRNDAGDVCQAVLVDEECGAGDFIETAIGVSDDSLKVGRLRPSLPVRTVNSAAILDPATDGLVVVDASNGNVTLTLTAPTECEPNMFMVKRLDTSENTVTVAGGANTIDGVTSISLAALDGKTIVWTGGAWVAIP